MGKIIKHPYIKRYRKMGNIQGPVKVVFCYRKWYPLWTSNTKFKIIHLKNGEKSSKYHMITIPIQLYDETQTNPYVLGTQTANVQKIRLKKLWVRNFEPFGTDTWRLYQNVDLNRTFFAKRKQTCQKPQLSRFIQFGRKLRQ